MRPLALIFGVGLALAAAPVPAQRAPTPPRFVVTPKKKLHFGRVPVGKRVGRWITLRNGGGGTVQVDWESHPSPEFETGFGGTGVDAGRKFRFKFFFQPPDKGRYEVPLVFTTDDPQRPEVTLMLVGEGYFRR